MPDKLLIEYRNKFFEALLHLLENEEYFDVSIMCRNGVPIGAHKVVLCTASYFFRCKFDFETSDTEKNIVMMPDIDADIMQTIVKFIYSGVLSIREETAQDLLIAADFIGLNSIITECCEFFKHRFDPSNIIGINTLASQLNCKILMEKSDNFRNLKFLEVSMSEEFLQMSVDSLIMYLSSSDLHVESEQQVFAAAMKWVFADLDNRMKDLTPLMHTIRFPLLSQSFLDHFFDQCSDKSIKFYFRRHLSEISLPNGHQLSTIERNTLSEKFTFRKSIKKMAYVIGGHIRERWSDDSTLNSIVPFDSTLLKHSGHLNSSSVTLNEARSGHCAAVVDKKLLVFGGEDNSIMLNSAESWEENDTSCNYLPPMTTPRLWAGACSVANLIYIFGGLIDGANIEKKIDIFDTWTNTWQTSVQTPRYVNACYAMGVIYVNGLIYLIGGINEYSKVEDQCLTYNPVTESFERICNLQTARSKFGIASIGSHIYVAGGNDSNQTSLNSVERYSTEEDKWEYIASMSVPRCGLGLVALDREELIVLGGEFRSSFNTRPLFAERYKPKTNSWELFGCDHCHRRDFCVVVV